MKAPLSSLPPEAWSQTAFAIPLRVQQSLKTSGFLGRVLEALLIKKVSDF